MASKKETRDYYTKATETKVDINNVRHEQEKQIRKVGYRKENKLSMSALAKIFGLNESTIREFINDGDENYNKKTTKSCQ